jgi:hypothetical protein
MKKIVVCLIIALLTSTFIPNDLKATNGFAKTELPADSAAIKTRLSEIKTMSKSMLTKAELKTLRKDVGENKKEHRGIISAVFFIAIGAVLAIIVLMFVLQ